MSKQSIKWFDEHSQQEIQSYLVEQKLLEEDEHVLTVKKVVGGNMNATLKLETSHSKSYIMKQSRDYVMRFPQLDAPIERSHSEAEFYHFIKEKPGFAESMPLLIHTDKQNYLNIFEVEEKAESGRFLYELDTSKKDLGQVHKSLESLVNWLARLHTLDTSTIIEQELFQNREMADFQRKQLFESPFEMLEAQMKGSLIKEEIKVYLWNAVRTSNFLLARNGLDQRFRRETKCLLHGDFFPGNWLFLEDYQVKVIDPEFCFFGPPEYDLGVFLAHLHLANYPIERIGPLFQAYAKINPSIDGMLTDSFARFEILRRIIGIARISSDEKQQEKLLQESIRFFSQ